MGGPRIEEELYCMINLQAFAILISVQFGFEARAQVPSFPPQVHQQSLVQLEFVRDCLIPTGARFQDVEIRGLSAIQYEEKTGLFHVLSDSKNPLEPQWLRFRLGMTQQTQKQKQQPQAPCFVPVQATQLIDPPPKQGVVAWTRPGLETDAEAIALNSDGSIFVSSEVQARGDLTATYPEILRFSKDGVKLGSVPVPEAYVPKVFRFPPGPEPVAPVEPPFVAPEFVPPPKPTPYRSDWAPRFVEDIVNSIKRKLWQNELARKKEQHRQQVARLREKHQKMIEDLRRKFEQDFQRWVDTHVIKHAGVGFNTAIEALSFDRPTQYLTAFVESSLQQDRSLDPQLIRVLRMKMNESGLPTETREFFYSTDAKMRVSEILDLGQGKILVLEITYDRSLSKVFSRIYEVKIESQLGLDSEVFLKARPQVLQKRLVLDLNQIEGRLDPAYPRLDNLEGMTLGPILPSGHRSLVLVSDNNGNFNQITQFLIFRLK